MTAKSPAAPRFSVLLVEDTPSLARLYAEYLRKLDCEVTIEPIGARALEFIRERPPEVALLDLQLPDMNGLEVLEKLQSERAPTGVVVITAHGSVNTAVEAMRLGAYDFLVKPFSADRLLVTVRNTVERLRLERIVETYREDLGRDRFHGFIGGSPAMQAVYHTIESAAASKATVFITGESGTGKEVCAEAIHRASPRRQAPFIALNCGAIPKDLMESEIFGHVKGAFTGAISDRTGAAAKANGGTLFLDEIAEMELALQTKLLRFVQTGTFQKVGETRQESVDIRIICATNRDPLAEVRDGRFREDLYYRLHVVPIQMPPLRDRGDDILAVARAFLVAYAREEGKHFRRFAVEAEARLAAYAWPGNVRQLQNVIRNAVVLNDGEEVTPEMLPPPISGTGNGAMATDTGVSAPLPAAAMPGATMAAADAGPIVPLWQVEKQAIEKAIDACDGNIPRAAALLQISASTIYRKKQVWDGTSGGT